MTKKLKHRIVVEITTNIQLTERQATWALEQLLNTIDTQSCPIYPNGNCYADNLTAKQFSRVFAAETLQRKRRVWLAQKYAGGKLNTLNRS